MNDSKEVRDKAIDLLDKLGEVGVDSFIKDGLLRDIPVIGSVVGIFKFGTSIADALLLAKIKRFIENIGSVSQEEKEQFNKKMKADGLASKTSRMILQYTNSYDSEQKAEIFGYLFGELIRGDLDEVTFRRFASLVGNMNTQDLKDFVLRDGKFDWLYAHDYIAHGLAMFEVPRIESLDDIRPKDAVDQTGMTYGVNPWGAEVIRVLKPYFARGMGE